jgi:phage-related tail fiber protein
MARPATAAVRLLTGEREPVRLATTANISLYGLQTIDGVVTEVGDRVLVKDQSDGTQNGIYTASKGQWFRAADARTSRTMQKGVNVHVQQGGANAGKYFGFQTFQPVVGTDDIVLDEVIGDTSGLAPKASPTFTGTPAAPTATPDTNTTQIATTAFVAAAISALSSVYQAASAVLTALAGVGTAVAGDIIYATGAGAWGRLAKGTASQALLMNSGATAPQWSTLPFTKSFQSAQQTITSAGSLTLAHGLGKKPGLLMTSLVCLTAEAGYSVGDEVFVSQAAQSLVPDATNINVRFGSTAGTSYSVMHKTTGVTPTGITNANWQLVVRAWA